MSATAAAPATSDAHKLFFIGPNKTGTRSWAALLHLLGLRVAHDAAWGRATHTKDLSFFDRADAFCDGDDFDVEWLAKAFPAAKFVFNTRPLLPWLTSRVFHAEDSVHAFLGGAVKSLALHNDDATVACWVIQRDKRLAQARKLVPERLLVADVTAPSARAAQFVGALAPLLPPRAAAAAAARLANGTLDSLPHDGGDHDRRAAATQKTKRVEERVRDVLRRMKANESTTMASGARWTEAMADACPRLFGMGGVSRGGGGRGGRTRAQAAR